MYSHHRSAKSVFTERSVLTGITLILRFQFFQQRASKHSVSFAMDKHNPLSFLSLVLFQRLAEFSLLIVQHLTIAHTGGIVEQFMDVQVYLHDIVLLPGLFHNRLRPGLIHVLFPHQSLLQRFGLSEHLACRHIILYDLIAQGGFFEINGFGKGM